jgi:hypothetical protein
MISVIILRLPFKLQWTGKSSILQYGQNTLRYWWRLILITLPLHLFSMEFIGSMSGLKTLSSCSGLRNIRLNVWLLLMEFIKMFSQFKWWIVFMPLVLLMEESCFKLLIRIIKLKLIKLICVWIIFMPSRNRTTLL